MVKRSSRSHCHPGQSIAMITAVSRGSMRSKSFTAYNRKNYRIYPRCCGCAILLTKTDRANVLLRRLLHQKYRHDPVTPLRTRCLLPCLTEISTPYDPLAMLKAPNGIIRDRPNRALVVKCGYESSVRRVTFPSTATCRLHSLRTRVSLHSFSPILADPDCR